MPKHETLRKKTGPGQKPERGRHESGTMLARVGNASHGSAQGGSIVGAADGHVVGADEGKPRVVSRQRMDELVRVINGVAQKANLTYMLTIGGIVVDNFYGGDVRALHDRGEKHTSLRSLANHPDLCMEPGEVYRLVAEYELFHRVKLDAGTRVTTTHLRYCLPYAKDYQEELIRGIENEGWSVRRLQQEIRVRGYKPCLERGGRRRQSSLHTVLHALEKCLDVSKSVFSDTEDREFDVSPESARFAHELVQQMQDEMGKLKSRIGGGCIDTDASGSVEASANAVDSMSTRSENSLSFRDVQCQPAPPANRTEASPAEAGGESAGQPPAEPSACDRPSTLSSARSASPGLAPKKQVLILDDDEAVGRTWARVASRYGDVTVVQTSRDAEAALVRMQGNYHVMIFDIILDDGSGETGLSVLQRFRKMYPQSHPRVVVVTGANQLRYVNEAWDLGAEFLTKPFTMERLQRVFQS